jgi:hypothetical protein
VRWAPGSQRESSTATAENPADHQNATWNAVCPSRPEGRGLHAAILMTYKPIPEERVLEIVDDLFMPLITASGTSGR